MDPGGLKNIGDLDRGSHLCCLYETEDEQSSQLTSFILKGMEEEEKVVCFADSMASEIYVEAWENSAPAIIEALNAGRVSFLADHDHFSRSGTFSPDRMLSSLQSLEKKALAEGFSGLRVAAEASWLLSGMSDSVPFIELESKLARYLPISQCALMIQYDRWVFDPSFLLDVLASHPVAAYGDDIYDNIYHVPPEELLSRDISSTSLRLWLANLRSNHRERELLRASEANFRGIFNTVSDAIFIRDIDTFEFVDANQRAQEIFGVTLEEIKQSPPGFLHAEILPVNRGDFFSIMEKAKQGYPQTAEWMATTRDGKSFWVESNLVRGVVNDQERIISTVRDISQRKKAEGALREATEYLNNLITSANAPIIVWDPERRITRFNRAFEHLTGYSEEEVMGRDLELLFPLDSTGESLDKIGDALSGERWESVEIPILTREGEVRVALWNSANIYADDGETLLATIAQGQDITGRKVAEDILRETTEYLDSLITYANAPIIVWDPARRISRFNQAFEHLTGYTEDEVMGRDLEVLFPRDSVEESLDKIDDALRGEHWESVEIPILGKDGTVRVALWNSANIYAGDGEALLATIAQGQDITGRKQAEEELQRSEERYRELVQNANLVIMRLDKDGKITFLNRYAQQFFGYAEEELLGKTVLTLVPEVDSAGRMLFDHIARIIENPGAYAYNENENIRKNGERVWVAWSNKVVSDEAGSPVEIQTVGVDITARRIAEEALRTSEANFRGIFDAVAEAIIIRDAESFRVVDANRKAEEMFGYTLEELKAGPVDMTSSGEAGFDLANSRRVLKEAAEGKPQLVVWKARRKDGGLFWVESSLTPAELDGKNRLVGTVRDISWRKQAEEDLERAEEKYRELVQNANSIILKWDGQGRLTFFNEYAQRFFGYSEAEVLGKSSLMLVPEVESDGRDLTRLTADIIESPDSYKYNENENVRKNGERVWVAWTNRVLKDEAGDVVEVLAVGVDITDRKRMESQLQAINRELSEYAHTISHDLHAPISTIHGYAQVAEEAYADGNPGVARESMGAIQRLTERMSKMTKSLLEYAEAEKVEGKASRAYLAEVLPEVLADHNGDIRSRGMDVVLQEEFPALQVDPVRLRQVLTNIIGNAIKFTAYQAEPRVRISAEESAGWVTLSVEDNGVGIKPELLDQIFEPFLTFHEGGSTGHGIGLATAKKVVEGWGGKIWAKSQPGGGSTFFFTVPAFPR